MSLIFTNTPSEFQPILSDGIYFTLSGSSYDPLTTFKFRYIYDLYVEDLLVFQGKCSPNPFGIGIVDLQQILETYTSSLPISYWSGTPIYTHTTFPFSRPANEQVINYQVKCGFEYADSEISPVTGFTGVGNLVGPPAYGSDVYKVFRSTMGVNGRATQQDFDINPFILSGTPQGVYPTTSGLFLTNAPRIQDIAETEYYTLGFTNYYLWSGQTSGFSQGYYVKYSFYDDQGSLISTNTYDNILGNGGGPRNDCNDVYQQYYLIDPVSATTEFNTLYVGCGPMNISGFPQNCVTYTVQLFGNFTGTTTPFIPTPTPTSTPLPTLTPTPSPTQLPCSGCTEYQLTWSGDSLATVTITNCFTQLPQDLVIQAGLFYNICSCTYPISELDVQILTGGPCFVPSPTPTKTPTPTPSSTPCVCIEYLVTNNTLGSDFIQYINCFGVPITYELSGNSATTFCACQGTVVTEVSTVSELGPCVPPSPTPTRTPTKTPTPTPTLTPGCFIPWNITTCESTCSGGICTCSGGSSITVYTNCSVTDITDPDTEIYENTALTNPFTNDFVRSGSIYNSTGSGVTLVCVIGGPC